MIGKHSWWPLESFDVLPVIVQNTRIIISLFSASILLRFLSKFTPHYAAGRFLFVISPSAQSIEYDEKKNVFLGKGQVLYPRKDEKYNRGGALGRSSMLVWAAQYAQFVFVTSGDPVCF